MEQNTYLWKHNASCYLLGRYINLPMQNVQSVFNYEKKV